LHKESPGRGSWAEDRGVNIGTEAKPRRSHFPTQ
jgi:hypothetical protein